MAFNKVKELRDKLERKRKEELSQRHLNDKMYVERAHLDEFNQFNAYWDNKMHEFNTEAFNFEADLIAR